MYIINGKVDMNKLIICILIVNIVSLIIGFISHLIDMQKRKLIEKTEDIIRHTNHSMVMDIEDYFKAYNLKTKIKLDEIERRLLTEIACLATKNNNDIKEIKDRITIDNKDEKINQLINENNKLKEENALLKKENKIYADVITVKTKKSEPSVVRPHSLCNW